MKRTGFKKKTGPKFNGLFAKPVIKRRTTKRASQEKEYNEAIPAFLARHPICPVTGEKTTQIHHSAKRQGHWLNLQRYWIAVSLDGHRWIENNKTEAKKYDLMHRIYESYSDHTSAMTYRAMLCPIFYETHRKLPLVNEKGQLLNAT